MHAKVRCAIRNSYTRISKKADQYRETSSPTAALIQSRFPPYLYTCSMCQSGFMAIGYDSVHTSYVYYIRR